MFYPSNRPCVTLLKLFIYLVWIIVRIWNWNWGPIYPWSGIRGISDSLFFVWAFGSEWGGQILESKRPWYKHLRPDHKHLSQVLSFWYIKQPNFVLYGHQIIENWTGKNDLRIRGMIVTFSFLYLFGTLFFPIFSDKLALITP